MYYIEENNEYRSKLIELVRKSGLLWDREHQLCGNRFIKMKAWTAIGNKLNKSPNQVRRNWQSLRDQYRQNLKRKLVHNIEPTWIFFNEMSFIRKFLRIYEVSKSTSDSESDTESIRERHENSLELGQSHETSNATDGNLMEHSLSAESSCEVQSQTNKLDGGPVCDSSEQDELDSCSIKMEIYPEEDDAFEKPEDKTKSAENTLNQLLTLTVPNQKTSTISDPTSMTTPTNKRTHADEVNCNVLENNKRARYGNRTIITQVSKILSKRRNVKGADFSTATADFEQQSHCQDSTMAAQTQQRQINQLPAEIGIEIDSNEDNVPGCYNTKKLAETQANDANNLCSSTSRDTEDIRAVECHHTKERECNGAEFAKAQNKTKEKVAVVQEDDDYHFVISILPFLRRTNLDRKLKTRMDIMRVIMEGLGCDNK